jgi:hypothetical protein
MRSVVLMLALVLGSTPAAPWADQPVAPVNTNGRGGPAIGGYDPVAYVTAQRPIEGSPQFELRWNGATWRFASAQNRDLFAASPDAYAPQFGGYCAYAVSRGYTATIDPQAWKIVKGKLYLNYSKRVQRRWEEDIPGNIARGEKNWPSLVKPAS